MVLSLAFILSFVVSATSLVVMFPIVGAVQETIVCSVSQVQTQNNVQKFYLRDLTATNPPTTGEKSSVLPVDTLGANQATGTQETRALRSNAGTSQVGINQFTDNTSDPRDAYHARFTSEALVAGTYGSGTWTLALSLREGHANSDYLHTASIYFWRPSDESVTGFVYDSHTTIGGEAFAQLAENGVGGGQVNDIAGSDVTIQNGDVLVLEAWDHHTQPSNIGRDAMLYFNGSTDPLDGVGTSDAGSYLNAPTNIPELTITSTSEPSCEAGKSLVWSAVGIVPVALFFGLFSLMSSKEYGS